MQKPIIVISAVNLVNGGAFTILDECLEYLTNSKLLTKFEIFALVHSKIPLKKYENTINLIEFPKSKKHFLNRIYTEYVKFKKLSKKLKPYLWLSLHDMTPNVVSDRRAVYMHNAIPFNKIRFSDLKWDTTYLIFTLFYKWIYRINVKKNNYCIVQQNWMRNKISELCKFNVKNIIVSHPINNENNINIQYQNHTNFEFFYPAFPRPFKNFEVICEAVKLLESKGIQGFNVTLTIDNSLGKYASWIVTKYSHLKSIQFIGLLDKDEMQSQYEKTDCLIFPSNLETWGLPISEFKLYNKPMIIADLPYGHETSQGANKVAFFNQRNSIELANLMVDLIGGNQNHFKSVQYIEQENPFTNNWEELFDILLK